MRLSIALATFNGEKFIEEQLASLRAQTRPADEVVISDDGSTDGTLELVRSFLQANAPRGWRLIENAKNEGYRENFRRAVAACGGDWVALCDQDDVWETDKLRILEEVALANGASAVLTGFSLIDAKGTPIPAKEKRGAANHGLIPFPIKGRVARLPGPGEKPLVLTKSIAMGCCMAFSRPVCERYLRLTRKAIPHDWELSLCAYFEGPMYFVNMPLTRYRVHSHNTIGLPGLTGGEALRRPSVSGREAIMDEYDAVLVVADAIARDAGRGPLSPRFFRYAALRREAIDGRSARKWLELVRYRDLYASMFTLRQRLGDLCVILRK